MWAQQQKIDLSSLFQNLVNKRDKLIFIFLFIFILVKKLLNFLFQRYCCLFLTISSMFVSVYDLLTGEKVKTLKGHNGCVRDVSWHPYRPEIASTSVSFFLNQELLVFLRVVLLFLINYPVKKSLDYNCSCYVHCCPKPNLLFPVLLPQLSSS